MSFEFPSSTRKATFCLISLNNLSRNCLDVTNFPSRPANGELLTRKFMDNVGSSISIKGNASRLFRSVMVSPISTSFIPAIPTISPVTASCASFRCRPSKVNNLETLKSSLSPDRLIKVYCLLES